MQACGLISLVDYFNVKACDIWEGNVTTRREILTEHICSPNMLGYKRGSDILEVVLRKLECTLIISQNVGGIWVLPNYKWDN